jgi:putative hemolysin
VTPAAPPRQHIVDALIEERAPRLSGGPFWPLIGPPLRALLGYAKARAMADAISPMGGVDALRHVSALLSLQVTMRGLEHVPREGRCILITNHPTGIADGIALFDAVHARRPDLCFFANSDALRVCRGLTEVLIPVAWPPETRTLEATKQTLRMARAALDAGRAIAIFAAGRMTRRIDGVMQDPPWEHSAVALARKHAAPLVPLHISGPYPVLFHVFDRISKELRDITLFHELLNKTGGAYQLTFGAPLAPNALEGGSADVTERLKAYVERDLPRDPEARLF